MLLRRTGVEWAGLVFTEAGAPFPQPEASGPFRSRGAEFVRMVVMVPLPCSGVRHCERPGESECIDRAICRGGDPRLSKDVVSCSPPLHSLDCGAGEFFRDSDQELRHDEPVRRPAVTPVQERPPSRGRWIISKARTASETPIEEVFERFCGAQATLSRHSSVALPHTRCLHRTAD